MLLIIHDLDEKFNGKIANLFEKDSDNIHIVSDNGAIKNCIGCFNCWVKTPGQCVLKDDYSNMGELMAKSKVLVILSECKYGTYSPFVKNVLDRSIPYIHPDFTKRNGEIHHKPRYNNQIHMRAYFYGAKTTEEKDTIKKLVHANTLNFNGIVDSIEFSNDWEDIFNENSSN